MTRLAPTFLIPLVFLVLGAFGISTHEFWQGETDMWAAFHTSNSFHEMVAHLGYTGHTLTFLIWQYGLYKFFHTPLAGSIANLVFMTAAVWLFVRTSPFSLTQKWLFALGFYPLYQYAVISRMYAYLIFFMFTYCALYTAKPKHVLLRWLMLVAMAETHVVGMLSAVPIALLDITRHWKEETNTRLEKLLCGLKLLFFIFAIASAIWQIWPADQSYHDLHPSNPFFFLLGLADGFFPNYGIFDNSLIQMIVGGALFIVAVSVLRNQRPALVNFLLFCIPLILFSAIIYVGERRNFGSYWIYWVMAIWLMGKSSRVVTILFAIQAMMGLYAIFSL